MPDLDPAAVTVGFRNQLMAMRDHTAGPVAATLAAVDLDLPPELLRRALLQWAAVAESVVTNGQLLAAGLSITYLRAWLVAAGAADTAPEVDVAARVGVVPHDVPGSDLQDALRRAAFAMLWRLRAAPRPVALRYGQYAATRVAWTAVQDNATGELDRLMAAHPQIVGWRRITSASACDRCVQAADRMYKPRTEPLERRHPSCRCTQGPVLGTS